MAIASSTIDATLDAGETREWAIATEQAHAVRADLSATGEPYKVDVLTTDITPNALTNVAAGGFDSALPAPQTIRDTDEHTIGSENIDKAAMVAITNTSNAAISVHGSINTHSRDGSKTAAEFLTRGPGGAVGTRGSGFLDGTLITEAHDGTFQEWFDLDSRTSTPPAPDEGVRAFYRTDQNEVRVIDADGNVTTWVTV